MPGVDPEIYKGHWGGRLHIMVGGWLAVPVVGHLL